LTGLLASRGGLLPRGFTARRISLALTIIALALWSWSVAAARLEIGFWGLVTSFPVTYYVSLGILTLASAVLWVSHEDQGKLLFLQLCFLVISIWLAPIMVGGAQPFLSDAYGDMGYVEYITRTGVFSQRAVWQHNWPAAWVFWAIGIKMSGASMNGLAGLIDWVPFLWQCLMFFPALLFFRNTIGKANPNYCWAAMWLFYLAFWFETQNTGAQAFGVFFVFSLLAVLTMTRFWQRGTSAVGHRASAIVLYGASAVGHLLGSFVSLAVTGTLFVTRRMKSLNLLILAVLFVGAWSIYGAAVYFEWNLAGFLSQALRLDEAAQSGVLNPLSGSPAHAAVAQVRVLFSGLFVLATVAGAFLTWRLKRIAYHDITMLAVAVGCGVAAVGVGGGYLHELFQRVFVFLLPVMAYFGVKLLQWRVGRVALCLLLLAAIPLCFVAKYGSQSMDYISRGYFAGAETFHEKTQGGVVVGGFPIGSVKNYEHYGKDLSYGDLEWEDGELVRFGTLGSPDIAPRYVCISDHDRAMLDFYYNQPEAAGEISAAMEESTNCSLVYANPDLVLYIREGQW
jgi:hypothetical protein